MVETLNNLVFVGEALCKVTTPGWNFLRALIKSPASDPGFLKASMRYTRDVAFASEALRYTPASLQA